MSAEIIRLASVREARRRRKAPSDREAYAAALSRQKLNDDRRWTPRDDDAWRQSMRELDEVIGPVSTPRGPGDAA